MNADDIKYFSTINCLADVDGFLQNIDKLMPWFCDWQLCFNASMFNIMHIGRKNWVWFKEFLIWQNLTMNVTWG